MPLHPSLKVDPAVAQQRSVLSRIERIKDLMRKGLWSDGQSVTGLPKTKILKIKAKKATKEASPEGGATTETPKAQTAAPSQGAASTTPSPIAPKSK